MEMINGYIYLDLTKEDVYVRSLKAIASGKPVVVKDADSSVPYFVDSITTDTTNVYITKGGKTITIANDNTITSSGDVQIKIIDLVKLTDSADDINNIVDFDNFIITKELYDKITSGLYPIKATLYDSIDFIGYPNLVSDNNNNIFTNVLIDTKYLMYYYDTADDGLCILVIGQLKDERYFMVCHNSSFTIINE